MNELTLPRYSLEGVIPERKKNWMPGHPLEADRIDKEKYLYG